jgi:hypothetical protein
MGWDRIGHEGQCPLRYVSGLARYACLRLGWNLGGRARGRRSGLSIRIAARLAGCWWEMQKSSETFCYDAKKRDPVIGMRLFKLVSVWVWERVQTFSPQS